jgi:hypothetical protein
MPGDFTAAPVVKGYDDSEWICIEMNRIFNFIRDKVLIARKI